MRNEENSPAVESSDAKGGTSSPSSEGQALGIRETYNAAVSMTAHDGALAWKVTGTFVQLAILLIAGAVFPSFIPTEDERIIAVVAVLVSIAGLVITGMFGSMVLRIKSYEQLWFTCAKNLESQAELRITPMNYAEKFATEGHVTVGRAQVRKHMLAATRSRVMLLVLFGGFFICFLGLTILDLIRIGQAF